MKRLTQSSEAEVKGSAIQSRMKSVPAKVQRLISEIREEQRLKSIAAKAKGPWNSDIQVKEHTRAIKELKKETRKLDTDRKSTRVNSS